MLYNFDQPINRRRSGSLKWSCYPDDVIPMWVADMDFMPPKPVVQALAERAALGDYGYPQGVHGHADELLKLRQVIVDRLYRHYRWQVELCDLFFIPGVIPAINLACHAFAVPDGVLVQPPVYPPIYMAAKTTGAFHQEVGLAHHADGTYAIDWKAFQDAITSRTRLFILCNPHNPVGRVYNQGELEQIAEICLQKNVIIVSDEIHSDLVYPGHPHIPIAALDEEIAQNTITLIAPSKTFNLAGLQCSVAIIQNPELRKKFWQSRKGLVPWVNLMGLAAAEAAYQDGQEWLDQLLVYLAGNRDWLYEFLLHELPCIKMSLPEGTYLAWLDCREVSIDTELYGNPHQFFLDSARVALNDGATFGTGGEGYVRLNFGCPRLQLVEGLEQMRAALPGQAQK
jgi:cystathionine beta-lyase